MWSRPALLALCALALAGCSAARPPSGTPAGAGDDPPGTRTEPSARRVDLVPDRADFTPLMSSTVGIGLTPGYSAAKTSPPFRYHWHTNYGYFVQWGPPDYQVKELGPDASTGGKVYWSYDPVEMDQRNKPPVEVVVTVRDAKTLDAWAEARLTLKWENTDTVRVEGRRED